MYHALSVYQLIYPLSGPANDPFKQSHKANVFACWVRTPITTIVSHIKWDSEQQRRSAKRRRKRTHDVMYNALSQEVYSQRWVNTPNCSQSRANVCLAKWKGLRNECFVWKIQGLFVKQLVDKLSRFVVKPTEPSHVSPQSTWLYHIISTRSLDKISGYILIDSRVYCRVIKHDHHRCNSRANN